MAAKKKVISKDTVALIEELHERTKGFKPHNGVNQEGLNWIQEKVAELYESVSDKIEVEDEAS